MEKLRNILVLEDVGYFGWDISNTENKKKQENLATSIEWENILSRLDVDGKPPFLTNIIALNEQLPNREECKLSDKLLNRRKNQTIVFWEYPYSIPPVIACYVANQRGRNLENTHFLIHGGILGLLARCRTIAKQETVMVQKLGGNVINIRIVVDKNGFLGDAGHQFERLVVGDKIFSKHSLIQHQHLRELQIGEFKILVYAEADAIDPNTSKPAEIKTKNVLKEKAYDRDKLKILLQMISNGSDTLITADRDRHADQSFTIKAVEQYPIDTLIDSLSEGAEYVNTKIETIDRNLRCIDDKLKVLGDDCLEMTFSNEEINLNPFSTESRSKATQHDYQILNSNFYVEHISGQNNSLEIEHEEIGIEQSQS